MFPIPATPSWFSRKDFSGTRRPAATRQSSSAVSESDNGSTPRRAAKYSSSSSSRSTTACPNRRTSVNTTRRPPSRRSCARRYGGSPLPSRRTRFPVIRRCIASVRSPSRRRRRYLPRRSTASIVRPATARSTPCGGSGRVQRSSSTVASSIRRPVISGSSWRRIVSTSGSSGMPGIQTGTPLRELRRVCPRVGLEIHLFDPRVGEVRVQLCRRDVCVAEHLLDRPQVAASGQQMGRERVAQRVWAHPPCEADIGCVALDHLVKPLARERAAPKIDEQPRHRPRSHQVGPARAQVTSYGGGGLAAQWDDALLVPLAAGADEGAPQVDVVHVETHGLGCPQAAPVHNLQQRPV